MTNHNSPVSAPMELVRLAAEHFKVRGIETPRLDAEVLLAHVLGVSRMGIYLNFDKPLSKIEIDSYREVVKRRANKEPISYITGIREFWSLDISVGPGVLIPRPETELLVESCLARVGEKGRLLDVGVGSGAISLAFLSERPQWTAVGIDKSSLAVDAARRNARRLNLADRIDILESDFFSTLGTELFSLIVSNPPYIPSAEVPSLMHDVSRYEPWEALDGGKDGLDVFRLLAEQGHLFLDEGGRIAAEFGVGQGSAVESIFIASGQYDYIEILSDYAGLPRIFTAKKK